MSNECCGQMLASVELGFSLPPLRCAPYTIYVFI